MTDKEPNICPVIKTAIKIDGKVVAYASDLKLKVEGDTVYAERYVQPVQSIDYVMVGITVGEEHKPYPEDGKPEVSK